MNDHPLIYCNGDSYSDENYHHSLKGKTYAHAVGEYFSGFVINNAIAGSSNRRIIRSSVHDLMLQRSINPQQKIIALIGLTFELRGEIWLESKIQRSERPEESNFVTHTFAQIPNWRERLLSSESRPTRNFAEKYRQGRAYYYSPYAERINLFCDLVMFQSLAKQLNVDFVMFQCPKAEVLEQEYLLDFFKKNLDSKQILDFENFGFTSWCSEQGFQPLDYNDRPEIGHYGPDAHRAFAEKIIIPHLENYERRH